MSLLVRFSVAYHSPFVNLLLQFSHFSSSVPVLSPPVCDDHDFSDEKLFYRFRRDDGTYEEPVDSAIVAKGQRLYGRSVCRGGMKVFDLDSKCWELFVCVCCSWKVVFYLLCGTDFGLSVSFFWCWERG